jgi:hypothetical protein
MPDEQSEALSVQIKELGWETLFEQMKEDQRQV